MNSRYRSALEDYGTYHRDFRNKLTHYVGIPMIVLSMIGMLQMVAVFSAGSVMIDLGLFLMVAVLIFYLSLDLLASLAMAIALSVCYVASTYISLKWLLALFVLGWIFQFIGHYFEGKKPAFLRNGVHLLIGPIWIINQGLHLLHLPSHSPGK